MLRSHFAAEPSLDGATKGVSPGARRAGGIPPAVGGGGVGKGEVVDAQAVEGGDEVGGLVHCGRDGEGSVFHSVKRGSR